MRAAYRPDRRTAADVLRQLAEAAESVPTPPTLGAGSWADLLFDAGELRDATEASQSLLLALARLQAGLVAHFDELPAEARDWYLQQRLGIRRRRPVADRVVLVVEGDPRRLPATLPKGAVVKAGKGPRGDRLYETTEALTVLGAQVLGAHGERVLTGGDVAVRREAEGASLAGISDRRVRRPDRSRGGPRALRCLRGPPRRVPGDGVPRLRGRALRRHGLHGGDAAVVPRIARLGGVDRGRLRGCRRRCDRRRDGDPGLAQPAGRHGAVPACRRRADARSRALPRGRAARLLARARARVPVRAGDADGGGGVGGAGGGVCERRRRRPGQGVRAVRPRAAPERRVLPQVGRDPRQAARAASRSPSSARGATSRSGTRRRRCRFRTPPGRFRRWL